MIAARDELESLALSRLDESALYMLDLDVYCPQHLVKKLRPRSSYSRVHDSYRAQRPDVYGECCECRLAKLNT